MEMFSVCTSVYKNDKPWVRMMKAGRKFANLPDVLVNVRPGANQYLRRGGIKYFRSEVGIQKLMRENGFISWSRYYFNVAVRWAVQVAMPNRLRGMMFKFLFRKKYLL